MQVLRDAHKRAPFLNFNGNTFAAIASESLNSEFPLFLTPRGRHAVNLAVHFVAGTVDLKDVEASILSAVAPVVFALDDRVSSMKGTLMGSVKKINTDVTLSVKWDAGLISRVSEATINPVIAVPEATISQDRPSTSKHLKEANVPSARGLLD